MDRENGDSKSCREIEINQLMERVHEQETLLVARQELLETLESEVETLQKTNGDLNFQKSKLEHEVNQYRSELEIAIKEKAAIDQELYHTQQLIEQYEAKRKKMEEEKEREAELQKIQVNANGLAHQPLASDIGTDESQARISAVREEELDALQQKLSMTQEKAEAAENKAHSFKKLLDESNNILQKLQMETETERISMRQKSEDLQQQTLNMRRTISDLQEEIRSLQRVKSSLEQKAFFQNTEVEGLKEQLKITQGELQKKSSMEQDKMNKMSNLEEELGSKEAVIDQLKFKCDELRRKNVSSDSDMRHLQIQAESLEKDRLLSEQKIMSLKNEIESWKQQLQMSKEESISNKRSEQASQLRYKNLEAEFQKSEFVASQLQKQVDELKQIKTEIENNLKNVKAELDQVTMESDSKDQQIKIFKSQVEGTKSQFRIIEEELNKKAQIYHELQMKLQDYNEEVKDMTELQQKNQMLNMNVASYEKQIMTLKSELKSLFEEKNLAIRRFHLLNAEINDLNMTVKKKNAELQKESAESQRQLDKVKSLEREFVKYKHSVSSDKVTENLMQEMNVLQNDKKAAEKKAETLNSKVSELSSSLQRAKEELTKETVERKVKDSKIIQLENELQKAKINMKEETSSSDKSRSNLQHENTLLKREKADTENKNISLASEIKIYKDKLQRSQTEGEQKQKEILSFSYRSCRLKNNWATVRKC
ncbi:myosin heavy chain, striated muscle-like [Sphaeramia orbicularis]|uniref:myosin heavy chain, striated muscle-like n=1 Tax=Sphaeramia orbicularis TaxID=375764 RepID=UPI00117E0796|nr:myosin heavy chain, striated muscle-like [Sphaeramia orbicularis]